MTHMQELLIHGLAESRGRPPGGRRAGPKRAGRGPRRDRRARSDGVSERAPPARARAGLRPRCSAPRPGPGRVRRPGASFCAGRRCRPACIAVSGRIEGDDASVGGQDLRPDPRDHRARGRPGRRPDRSSPCSTTSRSARARAAGRGRGPPGRGARRAWPSTRSRCSTSSSARASSAWTRRASTPRAASARPRRASPPPRPSSPRPRPRTRRPSGTAKRSRGSADEELIAEHGGPACREHRAEPGRGGAGRASARSRPRAAPS